MQKIKLKIGDLFFLALFIVVIAIFFIVIFKPTSKGKHQLVIESGNDKWIYQLDKNAVYKIPGKLGDSTIEIKDGTAFFTDSPCDNKICVFSKSISKNGEWIACLPNGVIIRIEGNNTIEEMDAIAQ